MNFSNRLFGLFAAICLATNTANSAEASDSKPDVLFISVDDLNDWIGCLGGHPQATTPNFDRLAASGVLFTNAHCPAPACNPCRTAIMTENPFPRTLYPDKRPVNLPRGGPWQYVETDWGGLDATDEEFGGDWLVSKYVGEQLSRKRNKPFFLACGLYRPHEPWFVPQKYFDQFPLDEIQLPPGYREDDLDDLPPAGKKRGPNRYFAHIREQGQWKQGIQGYLASISFADAMLGRVLDALENGPNADNTIVVLWSDHGWHLGEKQHWQKYTAWRACTRVPLILRVPQGVPGLANGTTAGTRCSKPVNLLSLFPTLTELAGLPAKSDNNGPSLVQLLKDSNADWKHTSVTFLGDAGSYGMSTENWRYIHYANDDEELYDSAADRYEWTNLAAQPEHFAKLNEMRAIAPKKFAARVTPQDESLPGLEWRIIRDETAPPSKPDGNPFDVVFINRSNSTVVLHWIDRSGKPRSYGGIEVGKRKRQQTRPGAVWLITDEANKPLGYFTVGDRTARAEIPGRLKD